MATPAWLVSGLLIKILYLISLLYRALMNLLFWQLKCLIFLFILDHLEMIALDFNNNQS